jgi:hypothetical protein
LPGWIALDARFNLLTIKEAVRQDIRRKISGSIGWYDQENITAAPITAGWQYLSHWIGSPRRYACAIHAPIDQENQ